MSYARRDRHPTFLLRPALWRVTPSAGPRSYREEGRFPGAPAAAFPTFSCERAETAPASDATEVSDSEKNAELASTMIPPARSVEAPKAEQPPRTGGNIAAQQNEIGDKS